MVEHLTFNEVVVGSSPTPLTNLNFTVPESRALFETTITRGRPKLDILSYLVGLRRAW